MSSRSRSRSRSPARRRATTPTRKTEAVKATSHATSTSTSSSASASPNDSFGNGFVKLFVMIAAATLVQVLWASCDLDKCHVTTFVSTRLLEAESAQVAWTNVIGHISLRSVVWLLIWFASQIVLRALLPGRRVLGAVQRDGQQLTYVLNGFICLVASLALGALAIYFDLLDLDALRPVTGELRGLVSLFQILSFVLPLVLGLKAYFFKLGERSGSFITDYFFGWEINPRIGSLVRSDIKWFLESHALIMWICWDALFVYQQYASTGTVSVSLALTAAVQTAYVVHHFHGEEFLLTMLDFTSENMGWMLTWGNIMFVGFLFALPTVYAAQNESTVWWPLNFLIAALALFGLYVFSDANHQKHQYKTHPERPIWGETPRTMPTARGTKLLLSGWWGVARKMNYTGDILLALCHGLPSGFDGIVPHIYFVYLTALLIHRAMRDEALCKAKYGKDWDRYCEKVPYQFIPRIY